MIIAFASKNHLGLNSDLGATIAQSAYFTVVELEGERLKKVTNLENAFTAGAVLDGEEVAQVLASTGAEMLVVGSIENEAVTRALLQRGIALREIPVARVADVLKKIQNSERSE
ncbi:MAG: NifB/NifX family molybdenum-iron cluster-binding protein [Candidatus Cryosericum sp.]